MTDKKITSEQIINILKENRDVLTKHGVKKIGLFGSFIRGEQKKNSDIDLIVEFDMNSFGPQFKGLYNTYTELCDYLESLFRRKVEILTPEGVESIRIKEIKEDIKKSIICV